MEDVPDPVPLVSNFKLNDKFSIIFIKIVITVNTKISMINMMDDTSTMKIND